jgi:peptidyl-prolyl cis-trans isomerase B (cyclophilin B)
LIAFWRTATRNRAMSAEARFKQLTRAEKLKKLAGTQVLGSRLYKLPHIQVTQERILMPTVSAPTKEDIAQRTDEAKTHNVKLTTSRGDIVLRLYPDLAPIHVASFLNLVSSGFYNGIVIHRVEPGFVIQAGCPEGNGTGGPGYSIPAEFNEKKHVKGILSMARTSDPNSAGSQFFICLGTASFLDNQYTVFGETIEGMDILSTIKRGDVISEATVVPA